MVRSLEGYGQLTFPHCPCDARKNGHVIPTLTFQQFKLQACTDDGTLEVGLHIEGAWFDFSELRFLFLNMRHRSRNCQNFS